MAVRYISTKLAIEGENEYRSGVKEINVELKTLGSELKLVESNFKGLSNTQAALTAKGDVLSRMYTAQAEKVSKLGDALKNAQEAQTAYNSRIETLKAKIAANDAEMDKLKVSTLDTSEAQGKLAEKTAALKKELDEAYGYETAAAKGVGEWQRQLNLAQVDLNSLNAEIKQNDKYLDEAKRSADGCATSIDNYGKQTKEATEQSGLLQKIFAGGFLANLASSALRTVGNVIKNLGTAALDTADQLKGLTAETGLSSSELQKLRYIGEDVGVSVETMATSMKRIVKSMNSARDGAGEQADAYRKLGVQVTEANGALRDGNTVYGEVLNALSKMSNETERDALAQIVLGRSATELNAIIELGAGGMKELGDQAEKTGAIMSEDAVTALDNLGDSIDHTKQSAEALVGEALAEIIATGDDATTTFNKLAESMNTSNDTLDLIAKYEELSAEISDTTLTEEQLAAKTSELEQTKQALIKASNGVVTAFNIENGTFDVQVAALQSMTQAQKENLKYQLINAALKNQDAGSAEKKAAAESKNAKAQDSYTAALAQTAETQKNLNKETSEGTNEVHLFSFATAGSTASTEILKSNFESATEAMTDVTKHASDFNTELGMLVNEGYLPANEACAIFGLKVEELNAILAESGGTISSTIPEIQSMQEQINALNADYQAAYDSAFASLQGQYDLWSSAPEVVQTSVAEMQAALDGNTEYFTNYKTNIETLMSIEIPGVDMQPLIDSISDGTPEAAARAQALADAIKNGNTDAVAELAKSAQAAKDSEIALATEMGKTAIDYDKRMSEIVDSTLKAVKDMDQTDEAAESGRNTLVGYINGVKSQSGPLNLAMTTAAQNALNAWKAVFEEHSPSKAMERSGENAIKGEINGLVKMQAVLADTATDMGRKLFDGLSKGMKDSSGKVMSTADDIAKELTARLGDMTSVFSASSDISELKYKLWALTSGKGATGAESAEAEIASLTEQAQLEEKQIKATQAAYAKMIELYGANGDESLKLQKQLLQEQIAYENIKKSIEDANAAKKAVATDTLPAMADQEYKLWYMENSNASDAEKLAREAEVLNLKMAVQSETVDEAAAALDEMVAKYGANADGSIKLREELLKEKIAYAELKQAVDELNTAKSKYDSSGADVPANFLQSAAIWDSLTVKKVNASLSTPSGVDTKQVGDMLATAVNAIGTIVAQKPSGDLVVPITVNGKEIARATIKDFRAVDAATPKVVSDLL